MKTPSRLRPLAAACIACMTASAALAAPISTPNYESFEHIKVSSGQTPTVNAASAIRVRSNGSDYTEAVGSHVTYLVGGSVKVSANKWRVFNVQLGIGALAVMNDGSRVNAEGNGNLSNFGSFHSVGVSQYPKKAYSIKDHPVQVPLGASGLGTFAVQRCNANKTGLMQKGVSRIAVFNQSRSISVPVAFHFAAQVHDKDKEEEHSHEGAAAHGSGSIGLGERYWRQATLWQNVTVICEKSPDLPLAAPKDPTPIPTGPQDLALRAGVTQSFLTLVEKSRPAGSCGVKLSGVIETNLPNTTVTFAYRNHQGVETPARTLKTDHSKTVMFVDDIDFSKGKGGGPGLTAPVAPGAPGNPTGAFAAPTSNQQFHGWYQIVGKNFSFKSNMAEYSFSCLPQGPDGLKAPSLGQPAPLAAPLGGLRVAAPKARPDPRPVPTPVAQTLTVKPPVARRAGE
jgi:hypothetical protein